MYHLECQSTKDETMVIRMFEYDISIAIEHASLEENDIWEIEFPQSCVLYIRNHRSIPEYHEAIVKFADGQEVHYRVPVLQAKKYTVDRIFEKRLLILLPYHILRYEHFLNTMEQIRRNCSICWMISGKLTTGWKKHRKKKTNHISI